MRDCLPGFRRDDTHSKCRQRTGQVGVPVRFTAQINPFRADMAGCFTRRHEPEMSGFTRRIIDDPVILPFKSKSLTGRKWSIKADFYLLRAGLMTLGSIWHCSNCQTFPVAVGNADLRDYQGLVQDKGEGGQGAIKNLDRYPIVHMYAMAVWIELDLHVMG